MYVLLVDALGVSNFKTSEQLKVARFSRIHFFTLKLTKLLEKWATFSCSLAVSPHFELPEFPQFI